MPRIQHFDGSVANPLNVSVENTGCVAYVAYVLPSVVSVFPTDPFLKWEAPKFDWLLENLKNYIVLFLQPIFVGFSFVAAMEGVLGRIASLVTDVIFETNRLDIIVREKEAAAERRRMLLQQRRRRRLWIHPINQLRMTRGVQSTLYLELRHNPHKFHNYVRMRIEHFDFLLAKMEDVIRRQDTRMRLAITPAERLMVTLRFLATGESMTSLHYQFRLGISTISGIVKDTCRAVWTTLQPEYIPQPSMEIWLRSAEEFQQICNFPNCVGAVDGKHIRIAKPAGTGSEYYNYKKYFSIVLMAIADANCRFLAVDIGAYGRSNDSQVLKNSPMGRCLYGESYDLPPARPLPGTNDPALEYVFVGDEAFQLSPHLLKPYSSRNLNHTKRVFNYRLTRARRVVECSFGILTAKWRVLLTAIKLKTTTIDKIIYVDVIIFIVIYCGSTL
ncbi:uncharacterized protein LOC143766979 [Ranitomeya variabilis]|uniref:uncharacterized protein LOC143766979 n=1 Tax=Ranitomeya variabilis TaxID=490064 RepID=UPI00405657D0